MSTPNDPARSASVGEQRTPRAPARARLPLLPSGPGGFTGCTPHEGSPTTVVAELWAELAAGRLESAAEDSPSWPSCLLYTSDAADEEDSVDLGGRRIIKKKKK